MGMVLETPCYVSLVAQRDRFFRGNPWALLGLVPAISVALALGQVWEVELILASAVITLGAWYSVWRWGKGKNSRLRSEETPDKG